MLVAQCFVTLGEMARFDVPHAQSIASCFVHVGGADAFECGAYFGLALCLF